MIRVIARVLIFGIGIFGFTATTKSEPWINTTDLQLRSDIETLSDIGVIKVPITTYPLMWSGIVKNIDEADIQNIPSEYKAIFWRVKKRAKASLSNQNSRVLKTSFASGEQVFRAFGDSSRGQAELNASAASMNKYFAWNLQVNRLREPFDNDTYHYDGSYIAGVAGNWIVSFGSVEKWWGASWDSANLISNNARAPFGITLNRNYSDAIELPVLNWLGQWSFSGFVSQLEETSAFKEHYFSGASFSFKPVDSLELSARATSISGGTALQYSGEIEDKQISAFDFRWRLPKLLTSNLPTNLYLSVTDEGQQGSFSTSQFGVSTQLIVFNRNWRIYAESSKTFASGSSFNVTYEDDVFANGYRFNNRVIGSTYDNDSKATTLGLMGQLSRTQSISVKVQSLEINKDSTQDTSDFRNTIRQSPTKAKRFTAKWQWQAAKAHRFDIEFEYSDKVIDQFDRQQEKYRLAASWNYYL